MRHLLDGARFSGIGALRSVAVYHLVAHLGFGRRDLADPVLAGRVWDGMQRAFPAALAGMVMPDHVHLNDECDEPDEARRELARALSRATYGRGRRLWLPVPPPELVREDKLWRVVRYVALNPCRKGLTDDPAQWIWSTYRDVMGAAALPWVDERRLATRLGVREEGFGRRLHRYVAMDDRVCEEARAGFAPAPVTTSPTRSLDEIARAAAASLRCSPAEIQRRGLPRQAFLALARSQGWSDSAVLADACGVTPRAIRTPGTKVDERVLRAGLMCLGSRRWTRKFEGRWETISG